VADAIIGTLYTKWMGMIFDAFTFLPPMSGKSAPKLTTATIYLGVTGWSLQLGNIVHSGMSRVTVKDGQALC
jgi:hypothetical protein